MNLNQLLFSGHLNAHTKIFRHLPKCLPLSHSVFVFVSFLIPSVKLCVCIMYTSVYTLRVHVLFPKPFLIYMFNSGKEPNAKYSHQYWFSSCKKCTTLTQVVSSRENYAESCQLLIEILLLYMDLFRLFVLLLWVLVACIFKEIGPFH